MAKPRMTKKELRFVDSVGNAIRATKVEGLPWFQQPGFLELSKDGQDYYFQLIISKTR